MTTRPFVTRCALIVAGLGLAAIAGAKDNHSVQTSEKVSPGQRLDIDLGTGGGLRIIGWDRDQVWVVSRWKESGCPDAVINSDHTADGARFETHYDPGTGNEHHCSLEIEIHVPRKFDVRLRSTGGTVELSNVHGTFEGSTAVGAIHLSNLNGTVQLSTAVGEIQVSDSNLEGSVSTGGGQVRFSNVSGPITGTSPSQPGTVRGRSGKTI